MAAFRLSTKAADDLEGIFVVGLDLFGYDQARRYNEGLLAAFARLAQYPQMARLREEITGQVRALPHKAHAIVYEVDAAGDVVILRIRHSHEDWLSTAP
jgi:toxin ParE1/3/4